MSENISTEEDKAIAAVEAEKYRTESHLRSVLKGVTWRMVGTLDTMILSYIFTGSIKVAAAIGGTEVLTKITLYYLHERAWQMAPRGSVRSWFKPKEK